MSANVKVCDVDLDLKEKASKFRFRKEKNIAAISIKVDPEQLLVIEDEIFENESIDDIVAELPDHLPRYLLLSYVFNHDDGRISYPLCLIFLSPEGTKPELHMMYAGSKNEVVKQLGATKVFELRAKDELTSEWLDEKLKSFR